MSERFLLNQYSPEIQYLCKKDKRLAKLISLVGPIEYSKHDNSYAFLVHEIIEQMLSVKAGRAIYGRLENLCNGDINPEALSKLSDEEIRGVGTSNVKVSFIRSLTDAVMSGQLDFNRLEIMDNMSAMNALMEVRGIGVWTAKMYLLFVLGRQDILPYEDVAFLQAYGWLYKTEDRTATAVVKKCKKWKPYSSIASRYLYRAIDTGLTKTEFHLYK